MDENEHFPLSHVPMQSLSLRLSRSTIKMQHEKSWKINKLNPTHDLIIGLSGQGVYEVSGIPKQIVLNAGDAILIPAYTRFRGSHAGEEPFVGMAQHFTLDLFNKGDVIRQMSLRNPIQLGNWDLLEPLVGNYRDTASHAGTTLAQHHQFMVFLLNYLENAFEGWKTGSGDLESEDHLSRQIMLAASQLSADPLGSVVEEVLGNIPYNADYFRRAFSDLIGYTPQKFRELKRMEFAANRLGMGLTVKVVASELGYNDPYFFSRMFKRYLGASPSKYRESPRQRPQRRSQ